RAATGRKPDVPHFIRTKTGASAERGMFETSLRDAPGFRPRSESGVFHFRGVIEPVNRARDSDSARVARAPDDGKSQIFIGVIAVVVFADVAPFQKIVCLFWRIAVPDTGEVLVRQRGIDERVLPGVVPRDPIADDRGELSDLDADVLRRAVAQKIFVQPAAGAAISWIEAAVDACLGKEINIRPNFKIEEEGQSRVEQKIVLGKNESRRRLIDGIRFEIGQSAQLNMETVLRIVQRKSIMDSLEEIRSRDE